jgi:hypothetical protein
MRDSSEGVNASAAPHLLADNEPLARDAYPAIAHGLRQLERVHRALRDTVGEQQLDPEVFLPGGLWTDLCNLDRFERWTYDLVNHVRCLNSLFTGFDTLAWERRDGPRVNWADLAHFRARVLATGVFPRDLDRLLEERFLLRSKLELSGYLAAAHAELVEGVPERFIARCPNRMGEIGVVHEGRILSPDLLTWQSRINAMVGGGATAVLEAAVAARGVGRVLEIGPGYCFIPYVLHQAFGGRLQIFLVDLPRMMAFGYAYLSGLVGADQVSILAEPGRPIPTTPFVCLPHSLVPAYADALPPFDVAYNAISLNEMNAKQVAFYLAFIDAHLADDGVFFLEQGGRYRDGHEDAMAAARRVFPRHRICDERTVGGLNVMAVPNSYFSANRPRSATFERSIHGT